MAEPNFEAGVYPHNTSRGGIYWHVGQLGKPMIFAAWSETAPMTQQTDWASQQSVFHSAIDYLISYGPRSKLYNNAKLNFAAVLIGHSYASG